MTTCRLLPVFLVLLQSGLAAAHAHDHPHDAARTQAPHLHAHDLLDLLGSDHDQGNDQDDDHDDDAVDLSGVVASAAPPAVELPSPGFEPIGPGPTFEPAPRHAHFPVGLPPSTAGPQRPLYLTFCTLTI